MPANCFRAVVQTIKRKETGKYSAVAAENSHDTLLQNGTRRSTRAFLVDCSSCGANEGAEIDEYALLLFL